MNGQSVIQFSVRDFLLIILLSVLMYKLLHTELVNELANVPTLYTLLSATWLFISKIVSVIE
jgi:hypothetical protein